MRTLLLCSALAPAVALAAPTDVRRVELNDGRTLYGEVVTTEPGGVRLRVPQGEIIVPFHQLQNMSEGTLSDYSAQEPWELLVIGPEDARRWVERGVRTIPESVVVGDAGLTNPLAPSAVRTAQACTPADLGCAVRATSRPGLWNWIVTVDPNEKDGAILRASTSVDSFVGEVKVDDLYDAQSLLAGLDTLLALRSVPDRAQSITVLDAAAPERSKSKSRPARPAREPRTSGDAPLDAFVPIPGYAALKRGDGKGFALAMAIVVPASAAWVGLTGSQSQSAPEHAAMSVGGFYLTTVVVNQILGVSDANTAVSLGPTATGHGAQIAVRIPLR